MNGLFCLSAKLILVRASRLSARKDVSSRSFCVLRSFYDRKSRVNAAGIGVNCPARLFTITSGGVPNVDVTIKELKKMMNEGKIQLFDVREPHEILQHGKIPTSTNIPLRQIAEAFTMDAADFEEVHGIRMPQKEDSDIVFHCKAGIRSQAAMAAVHQIGYNNARHFPGGFDEWEVAERE